MPHAVAILAMGTVAERLWGIMNTSVSLVWAITILGVAGVMGMIGIEATSSGDTEKLLIILVGFLAPTVASLVSAIKSDATEKGLKSVNNQLNGGLDTRMEAAMERVLAKREAESANRED